jgi:hypothetical protein
VGQRFGAIMNSMGVINTLTNFQTTYSISDIQNNVSSTTSNTAWGFGLKPI